MVQNPWGSKAKAKERHRGTRIYVSALEWLDVIPLSQKSIVSWNRKRDSEFAVNVALRYITSLLFGLIRIRTRNVPTNLQSQKTNFVYVNAYVLQYYIRGCESGYQTGFLTTRERLCDFTALLTRFACIVPYKCLKLGNGVQRVISIILLLFNFWPQSSSTPCSISRQR